MFWEIMREQKEEIAEGGLKTKQMIQEMIKRMIPDDTRFKDFPPRR